MPNSNNNSCNWSNSSSNNNYVAYPHRHAHTVAVHGDKRPCTVPGHGKRHDQDGLGLQ